MMMVVKPAILGAMAMVIMVAVVVSVIVMMINNTGDNGLRAWHNLQKSLTMLIIELVRRY